MNVKSGLGEEESMQERVEGTARAWWEGSVVVVVVAVRVGNRLQRVAEQEQPSTVRDRSIGNSRAGGSRSLSPQSTK